MIITRGANSRIGRRGQLLGRGAGTGSSAPSAALVVGLGQSLMAARGTIVQSSGGTSRMAVGGAHVSAFDFWATNQTWCGDFEEWASLVTFAEGGGGQSPLAGVANTLTGYADVVLHSAAIGARTLVDLHKAFFNVASAVERGVALLVADGYARADIDVIYLIKHGEADAVAGTSQADYEAYFGNFVAHCRIAAKQALRNAAYVAPLHMSFPIQQNQTSADRVIKKALLAQAIALPQVYFGEVWSVPVETDRVHPTPDGYVLGGERAGRQIVDQHSPMRCTSVSLVGSEFTATFNKNVVRDTSLGLGTGLNASFSLDGFEFWDGAAYVQITDLVYAGATVVGTLASSPLGGELRIAVQDTAGTLTADPALHVGCALRSDEAGWASTFDPTYTHHDWCIPQIVEVT